jgi:hypothetical protein
MSLETLQITRMSPEIRLLGDLESMWDLHSNYERVSTYVCRCSIFGLARRLLKIYRTSEKHIADLLKELIAFC